MGTHSSDYKLWSKLFFKLLPYQILLLIIDASNGIVDSICASNFIGNTAMNAIGIYSPLNHFLFALSIMLVSGSQLMVGKAMGRNEMDSVKNYFSTDIILSILLSVLVSILLIIGAVFDFTVIMVEDPVNRRALNQYLLGQSFGIPALVLGQQLFSFLSLENQRKRTMIASFVCFLTNTAMDLLLVGVFKMDTFGLGLGSAIALWAFCSVMLQYYIAGRSDMKFSLMSFDLKAGATIVKHGYSGATSRFLEMFRCIIVNYLILQYVGSIGISAFAAVNSVMAIFWPVIFGMVAVTRMLLSITIGEEDRQSLAEIMRVLFKHGMLLCFGIVALIILMAVPFTNMFYQEPAETVYSLTVQGFRILPLCMPLAVLSLGFVAYTQAMENKFLSNVIPVVDGAVGVVSFSFILIPLMKLTGLYISNILNGVVCGLIILGYSIVRNRHFPKNIEEFLVIPDDFGVPKEERLDLEIHNLEEVTKVSEQIIDFSSKHNVDHRRANLSGLALEEMAINILKHGFAISPGRDHQIIIRVVHKDDYIILRILDNCTEFDPFKRITNDNDIADIYHTGIRIAYSTAKDVQYQNLLGLNVLTFSI